MRIFPSPAARIFKDHQHGEQSWDDQGDGPCSVLTLSHEEADAGDNTVDVLECFSPANLPLLHTLVYRDNL
ncbi:hypothetical protein GN956_G22403 [Arapaima gigas]